MTPRFKILQGDRVFLNWLNLWPEPMLLQGDVQKLEQQGLGVVMK